MGNGKQALALVARALRAAGVGTVLAPRYRCEAMALPFALEGMGVRSVGVGADLLLDPPALREALAREPGAAVLHCETYGNRCGEELGSVLGAARRDGSVVVLDATHSAVDRLIGAASAPGPPPEATSGREGRRGARRSIGWTTDRGAAWDVVVASARKLLPVPDGAWLEWSEGSPLAAGMARVVARLSARRPVDERATALGVELGRAVAAMRASHGSSRERSRLDVCEIAARHEEAVETALTPAPASARTVGHQAVTASTSIPRARERADGRAADVAAARRSPASSRDGAPPAGAPGRRRRGSRTAGRQPRFGGLCGPARGEAGGGGRAGGPARARRRRGGAGPCGDVGAGELAGSARRPRRSPMADRRHRADRRAGAGR